MAQMHSGQEVLDSVLREEPADAAKWLARVRLKEEEVPGDFNWRLFAQAAAAAAGRTKKRADALTWARIALSTYDDLLQRATTAGQRFSLLPVLMHLRARLIAKYGPQFGDPVLDLDYLVGYIHANVPLSYDQAVLALSAPTTPNGPTLLTLRRLKNLLSPMRELAQSRSLELPHWLHCWLLLYDDLP